MNSYLCCRASKRNGLLRNRDWHQIPHGPKVKMGVATCAKSVNTKAYFAVLTGISLHSSQEPRQVPYLRISFSRSSSFFFPAAMPRTSWSLVSSRSGLSLRTTMPRSWASRPVQTRPHGSQQLSRQVRTVQSRPYWSQQLSRQVRTVQSRPHGSQQLSRQVRSVQSRPHGSQQLSPRQVCTEKTA